MSILDLLFLNFWMAGFSLIILPTAVWVLIDATNLKVKKGKLGGGFFDMGATGWFLSCLLLWIIAFPAYLAKRGEYKRQLPLGKLAQAGSGYRKCPDCAELVRVDARKCRFCGLDLPALEALPAGEILPIQSVAKAEPEAEKGTRGRG
jgi:hypothetical protein